MNANFCITLKLMLYNLKIKYEESPLLEENPCFGYAELYSPSVSFQPECLIVGMLSEILPVSEKHPEICFLCIRDRFTDESERIENMKNIVVLLSNLKLHDLFNQMLYHLRRLQKWNTDMAVSVAANEGIQHLLDLSEPVIGNHIDIMDATFKLLGYTRNIPLDDSITADLITYGYHADETINKFQKLRRFEQFEKENDIIVSDDYKLCKYVTLKRVFHVNDKPALYVVMHCNNREADDSLLDLFRMFLSYVSRYTESDFLYPATFAASQQYIKDLLDGCIDSVDEAITRSSYATIPFQQDYQLYLVAFDDNFNTPLDKLAININQELPFSYVLPYHRRIVTLHSCKGKTDSTASVMQILEKTLLNFPCTVGISNVFQNLWETRSALEQAGCAIEYGAHVRRTPEVRQKKQIWFYDFEQCFLTLIVAKSFNSSPEIFRNCFMIQSIQILEEYDNKHNSNLLGTLQTYLQCNRKATETSEILHMHRNTILYHLDRIEQLLHISLDDAEVCLKLQLGIATVQSNMTEILL